MSLLIGDDYPEAVEPHVRADPAPGEDLRDRPATGAKRRDWSRWRGRRPRSMLIQDVPEPGEHGGQDEYGAGDDDGGPPNQGNGFFLASGGGADGYPQPGYPPADYPQRDDAGDRYPLDDYPADRYPQEPYPGDRITEDLYPGSGHADSGDYWDGSPGTGGSGYPEPGRDAEYDEAAYDEAAYDEAAYDEAADDGAAYAGYGEVGEPGPGHPASGYRAPRYSGFGSPLSGHLDSGHPGAGQGDPDRRPGPGYGPGAADGAAWYTPEGDSFRGAEPPDEGPWDAGGYEPDLEPDFEEEQPARPSWRTAFSLRRGPRDRGAGGYWTSVSRAQRLGGVLLAAASVVGAGLYVPSILAADSRSFTGVVSSSGIASLNFGTSGRVGTIRVHLGQAVRRGELLATETGGAPAAAVRADRAAITADKANLAALQADGSAAASITAAEAQLARDRARRAADQMKLATAQIDAPGSGTVVAIFGQPGETVSPAGLSSSATHAEASAGQQHKFSLLPSGPVASLRATGMALPVVALRTGGGWQVRLLIPQTATSAVKVGGNVTISVPAARLSGIKGTIRELSPMPVASSGSASYEAVVQVSGRSRITPLSGMTADVRLGSLRRLGGPRLLTGAAG